MLKALQHGLRLPHSYIIPNLAFRLASIPLFHISLCPNPNPKTHLSSLNLIPCFLFYFILSNQTPWRRLPDLVLATAHAASRAGSSAEPRPPYRSAPSLSGTLRFRCSRRLFPPHRPRRLIGRSRLNPGRISGSAKAPSRTSRLPSRSGSIRRLPSAMSRLRWSGPLFRSRGLGC